MLFDILSALFSKGKQLLSKPDMFIIAKPSQASYQNRIALGITISCRASGTSYCACYNSYKFFKNAFAGLPKSATVPRSKIPPGPHPSTQIQGKYELKANPMTHPDLWAPRVSKAPRILFFRFFLSSGSPHIW